MKKGSNLGKKGLAVLAAMTLVGQQGLSGGRVAFADTNAANILDEWSLGFQGVNDHSEGTLYLYNDSTYKWNGNVNGHTGTWSSDGQYVYLQNWEGGKQYKITPYGNSLADIQIIEADGQGIYSYVGFNVASDTAPQAQPLVNPVDDGAQAVTGVSRAGSTVVVQSGSTTLGTATAGEDGAFSVPIQWQAPGTVLSISSSDSKGNVSAATNVTVTHQNLHAPSVDRLGDTGTQLSGKTADPDVTSITVTAGGNILGTATPLDNQSGAYFYLPIPAQPAGTVLTVTESNAAGSTSPPTNVTVAEDIPKPPVVYQVGDSDTVVKGKVTSGDIDQNCTITVTAGSVTLGKATSLTFTTSWDFSIPIPAQKKGTTLTITEVNSAGHSSPPVTTTVVRNTPPAPPVVNPVGDSDTTITGTAEPGSTVTINTGSFGSTTLGTVTAGSDGSFVATIPKQKAGTNLFVTATAAGYPGLTSQGTNVTVNDTTPPVAPTINITGGGSTAITITGQTEASALITVKNGTTVLGSSTADIGGGIWMTISALPLGTLLSVTATDGAGNTSIPTYVTVGGTPIQSSAPSVDNITVTNNVAPAKDTVAVSGLSAGDIVTVYGDASGTNQLGQATVATGQTSATISIDQLGTTAGTVYVSVTSPGKTESSLTAASYSAEASTGNSQNPVGIFMNASSTTVAPGGQVTVMGEVYDSNQNPVSNPVTVNFTTSAGTVSPTSATTGMGDFSTTFTAPNQPGPVTITASVDGGNGQTITSTINLDVANSTTNQPPTPPSVNVVKDTDNVVTGTADAGTTITISANGQTIGSGVAGADGKFSITISPQKTGTTLTITAVNTAGISSASVNTTVERNTLPTAPVVNPVGDSDTTVTGTAEPGSTVSISTDLYGSTTLGTVIAGSDGSFVITIPKQKAGTNLYVTATAVGYPGLTSQATTVVVKGITAPAAPTINITGGGSTAITITGTTEPGAVVTVTNGTTVLGTSTAGLDGSIWMRIPAQPLGTLLSITATDGAGNTSQATDVTVGSGPVQSQAPEAYNITVTNNMAPVQDSVAVSGLAAGDIVTVYGDASGANQLGQATVPTGQTFATVSIDQLGTSAGTVYVSVTSPGKTESSLTPAPYAAEASTGNSQNPVGISMNASSTTVAPGGQVMVMGEVYDSNQFPVSNPVTVNFTTSAGTVTPTSATTGMGDFSTTFTAPTTPGPVTVTATVDTGNSKTITGTITFTVSGGTGTGGNSSSTLTGTVTDEKTNQPMSGVVVSSGSVQTTTDASGNYSIDLPVGTDTVEFDKPGYISRTVYVDVPALQSGETYSYPFKLASSQQVTVNLTSTTSTLAPGGQATVTGSVYGPLGEPLEGVPVTLSSSSGLMTPDKVTTDASGNFSSDFFAPMSTGPVTVTAAVYSADPSTNASITLNVAHSTTDQPPTQPSVNVVTDTDKVVTGSADAGSTITITANGQTIGSGVAGVDGKFSITISPQKANTVLTVTATDAHGLVSQPTSVTVWGDNCFIATAAFGSKFEPNVALLRKFRDTYLLTNKPGQSFVRFYYRHSPRIADSIRLSERKRRMARGALYPVVAIARFVLRQGN